MHLVRVRRADKRVPARTEPHLDRLGACVAVANTGPGISPADRPRVFERFYRGASGRRAGGGTGLGLAIVEELVRRWGGEVRLVDAPGTRLEAVFPLRAVQP